MKQMLILVVIAMLAVPLFAEESVLIDFSLLTADITIGDGSDPNQNQRTLMDFSHVAGVSFAERYGDVMKTSLAIQNWEVILASSSRNVTNMSNSFSRPAKSEQFGTVLGVRVHFPVEPFNSWAKIIPPYEIPAYELSTVNADGTIEPAQNQGLNTKSRFESAADGEPAYGVIKNVGAIKEIQVQYYGLNFPYSLSVILIDGNGTEKNYYIDNMRQDGWVKRTWVNPAYLQEVRNREIRLYPLYPYSTPFVKFGGFLVQRDSSQLGGDFVTYFKDVSVIYDLAVNPIDRDIDDEATWNIIETREEARKVWEMERFGQNQVLRYLEQQRQATELPFSHPDRQQN